MSHTPGPWTVREPDAEERELDIAEGVSAEDMELTEVYADEAGDQVCFVMNTTPCEAANARLIAAAPDLLEACKYMLENAESQGWSEFMLGSARAAISKAEGRSE